MKQHVPLSRSEPRSDSTAKLNSAVRLGRPEQQDDTTHGVIERRHEAPPLGPSSPRLGPSSCLGSTRPELASLGAVPGMARKGCSCPAIFVVTLLLLFNLDVLLAVKLTVV